MRTVLGRVACVLGFAACFCAQTKDAAYASATDPQLEGPVVAVKTQRTPARELPTPREVEPRPNLLFIEDALPWGGHFKVGRFVPAANLDLDDDWMSRRSRWAGTHSTWSIDRTFMTAEAGGKKAGLRGVMSTAGQSKSDELHPRFTLNAYQRWGDIGPASRIVTSASATTGTFGDRRFYAYTSSGRFSVGPLSLFGQGGIVDTELAYGFKRSRNALAEASWHVAGRFDTKVAFEWLDPNEKRRGDERKRIGIGLDPAIHRHVRAGIRYRMVNGPAHQRGSNTDELSLEVHASF